MRSLLLLFGVLLSSPVQAGGLLIIASPQVPVSAISVKQLADIYTLKKSFWAGNIQVVAVNREASSVERGIFTGAVFDLSPQELGEFWNRLAFQGKLPPLIQTSDQAVLGFVRSVPGAIGYINANQQPDGVKVLLRLP
jgi:ABC-type phosphate transport system substrate-binding protein